MNRRRRPIIRGAVPSARSHERLAGTPARWPVVTFCSGAGSRSHSPREICAELREMQFRRWAYVVLVIRLAMEEFGGHYRNPTDCGPAGAGRASGAGAGGSREPRPGYRDDGFCSRNSQTRGRSWSSWCPPRMWSQDRSRRIAALLRRLAPALPRRAPQPLLVGTNPGGSESTAPNAVRPPQPTTYMDVRSDSLKVDDP